MIDIDTNLDITIATDKDNATIHDLLDRAFGLARHQRAINKRRKDLTPMAQYSFVGYHHNDLIASIRFYACVISNNHGNAVSDIIPFLGPLAVDPDFSNQGIGKKISLHALDKLRADGIKASMLIGDPKRYQSYGFDANLVKYIDFGDDTAPLTLMGLEFEEGYLASKKGKVIFVNG